MSLTPLTSPVRLPRYNLHTLYKYLPRLRPFYHSRAALHALCHLLHLFFYHDTTCMYYITSFIQLLSLLHIIAGMHHTVTCPTNVPFTTVGPTCILHIHTPLVSLLPCTACMRHIAHTMSPTPLMSPLLPYTLQISYNNSYPIPCVFLHH